MKRNQALNHHHHVPNTALDIHGNGPQRLMMLPSRFALQSCHTGEAKSIAASRQRNPMFSLKSQASIWRTQAARTVEITRLRPVISPSKRSCAATHGTNHPGTGDDWFSKVDWPPFLGCIGWFWLFGSTGFPRTRTQHRGTRTRTRMRPRQPSVSAGSIE